MIERIRATTPVEGIDDVAKERPPVLPDGQPLVDSVMMCSSHHCGALSVMFEMLE